MCSVRARSCLPDVGVDRFVVEESHIRGNGRDSTRYRGAVTVFVVTLPVTIYAQVFVAFVRPVIAVSDLVPQAADRSDARIDNGDQYILALGVDPYLRRVRERNSVSHR